MAKVLNGYSQESLIALLCYDKSDQGAKAVAALVPAKSFDPFYRELAESVHAYLDVYNEPPCDHTIDLIEDLKAKRPDSAEVFDRLLASATRTFQSGINNKYVLDSASKFVRRQRLKAALAEAVRILQRDDPSSLDEAESTLTKAIKGSVEITSPGLLFNDPEQSLRFLDVSESETMPLGIPELDNRGLGPIRGGMWLFAGLPNSGKTWCGIHVGRMALLQGKRVLHVTLEMSENRIAKRYAQAFVSVEKRPSSKGNTVRRLRKDALGRSVGFDVETIRDRPNLQQEDIREVLRKKLAPLKNKQPLKIKAFPSGQLTIKALKAYLDWLEGAEGFVPDVLILDSLDIMEIDPKYHREMLGKLGVDFKGIAEERNIFGVTFSQIHKEAMKKKVSNLGNLAEDFKKGWTADTVITFNQSDSEQKMGLARLYVAKARDDEKNFQVLISQCYALGQFVVDSSKFESGSYWTQVESHEDVPETPEPANGEHTVKPAPRGRMRTR